MKQRPFTRKDVTPEQKKWLTNIKPKRGRETQRYNALKDYLNLKPVKDICETYEVDRALLVSMLRRAFEVHADGRTFGYRVCREYERVKQLEKKAGSRTSAGKFMKWLSSIQEKEEFLELLDNAKTERISEDRVKLKPMSAVRFHADIFVPFCRRIGIENDEYPLNTYEQGLSTIRRLFKNEEVESVAVNNTPQEAAARTDWVLRQFIRGADPLTVVQCDEYKINLVGTVKVTAPDGKVAFVPISDAVLLILVDAAKPIIYGYTVFYHPVAREEDMIDLLNSSTRKWKRRNIRPGRRQYMPGAGLPSGIFPELEGAQAIVLMADRAKAHKAYQFSHVARASFGLALNLNKPYNWVVRNAVEGTFAAIARELRDEPNSTGPDMADRNEAYKAAVEMKFDEEDFLSLVDVVIANFNCTNHGGQSGLEILRQYLTHDENLLIRKLPPPESWMPAIGEVVKNVQVRPSATGNYVEHFARWKGTALGDIPVKEVVQIAIGQDARYPRLIYKGVERGYLTPEARWLSHEPYSYQAMVAAARNSKRPKRKPSESDEPAQSLASLTADAERRVAATPPSRKFSPSEEAALLADLRKAAAKDCEDAPLEGSRAPDGAIDDAAAQLEAPMPATEPSPPAPANVLPFQRDPALMERIKALGSVTRRR